MSVSKQGNKWRACIHHGKSTIAKTFYSEEDALVWEWYKKRLLNNMEAFNPPEEELLTLRDAIDLKIESMKKNGLLGKSLSDISVLRYHFEEYLDKPLSHFSIDVLKRIYTDMRSKKIRRGGAGYAKNNDTGELRQISPVTALSFFKRLSTVFSNAIECGFDIQNKVLDLLAQIRNAE